MFQTLLSKEFREQWRTWKAISFLAVLLISGMLSPVLARYTPELLRAIPDMPAGLADFIPEPSLADSVAQYLKNAGQFGILLVILLNMGSMAQEKERGTAAMLLTKPVLRCNIILAKWLSGAIIVFAGILLGGLGCMAYTAVLFEPLPVGPFALLNLLLGLEIVVYLSVAVMASTLARTQALAAVGAFGGLVVLMILGALPRVGEIMPGQLSNWGMALVTGGEITAWGALGIAAGLIALVLFIACLSFRREEI